MYNPASFTENDPKVLIGLIKKHPLGLLITAGPSGLLASPAPFLCRFNNDQLTLVTHLAKANAHWKDLTQVSECLIVFQGDENYVTPAWYPSKKATHKVVPTWNYAIVQARGTPTVMDSPDWLRNQVEEITDSMEEKRATPWKVSDAPPDYIATQLMAIVGVEIEITEITGKWKMSQNRSPEDASGVAQGLANGQDPHANPEVSHIVSSRISGQ